MVLVLLALIWAAVLIPPILRGRAEARPADSIGDFRKRLGILQRTTPMMVEPAYRLYGSSQPRPAVPPAIAQRRRESARRRREILTWLGGSFAGTSVLGFASGARALLMLGMVLGVLLGAYVVLLVQMRQRADERSRKLRYLPAADATAGGIPGAAADAALEQSAN